jgi:hypothetical protein
MHSLPAHEPDFAVPYAAPKQEKTRAEAAPMKPKKGAVSWFDILLQYLRVERRGSMLVSVGVGFSELELQIMDPKTLSPLFLAVWAARHTALSDRRPYITWRFYKRGS